MTRKANHKPKRKAAPSAPAPRPPDPAAVRLGFGQWYFEAKAAVDAVMHAATEMEMELRDDPFHPLAEVVRHKDIAGFAGAMQLAGTRLSDVEVLGDLPDPLWFTREQKGGDS